MSENNTPKVSIGMPVYNGENYIRDALDSLSSQTFTDFELIISDNCSTDKTKQICEEYAIKDFRIRYIRQSKNIGVNANFEYVLQEAVADYFLWAACDDRWAKSCIQSMVNVLDKNNECGLVFSNYKVRNLVTNQESMHHVKPSETGSVAYNYISRFLSICPSLMYGMYRTKLIKNTVFEQFDFADVYFVSEVSIRTKIKIIDDFLYIAGTKGEREPYSFSGNKIDRIPFLRKQYQLLKQHFTFPFNILMFGFVCLYMSYNKIRLWRY